MSLKDDQLEIGFSKHTFLSVKLRLFSYRSVTSCVLGVQKNCLIKTVLLSTHNILLCFDGGIRK